MAKTKNATKNCKLDKTLVVDNITYDINAVEATHSNEADKVANTLTINKIDIEGNAGPVVFDGSAAKDVSIVGAEGGKFSGPIVVPTYEDKSKFESESVLNYADMNHVIGQLTGFSWYTWDGATLAGSVNSENQALRMGVVKGLYEHLDDFIAYNSVNKYLPFYLYICSDTGMMFFGDAEDTELKDITQVNAKDAEKLLKAVKLITNLESNNAVDFDGSKNVELGVKGVLPVEHGGTGSTTLDDVVAGEAGKLAKKVQLYTDLTAPHISMFDGSEDTAIGVNGVLPVEHGGTGQQDLERVTVGTALDAHKAQTIKVYYTTKIAGGTSQVPKYADITISPEDPDPALGSDGCIWIKYKA